MRFAIFFTILFCPMIALGQVAAVTEIRSSKVTVYQNHDGGAKLAVIPRGDVQLPAAQLSNLSEFGLIQVELRMKDAAKEPIVGWILHSSVKTDASVSVDVISPCGKSLATGTFVSRGTRGLGGC